MSAPKTDVIAQQQEDGVVAVVLPQLVGEFANSKEARDTVNGILDHLEELVTTDNFIEFSLVGHETSISPKLEEVDGV